MRNLKKCINNMKEKAKIYRNSIKEVSIPLIILILIWIAFFSLDDLNIWKGNWIRNNIIWAVIVIFFFDLIINIKEKHKESKVLSIVNKKIKSIFENQLRLLTTLCVYADLWYTNYTNKNIDFFTINILEKIIDRFDLSYPCPRWDNPTRKLFFYDFFNSSKNWIEKLMDKYTYYMPADMIETLESFNKLRLIELFLSGNYSNNNNHLNKELFLPAYIEYIDYLKKIYKLNDQSKSNNKKLTFYYLLQIMKNFVKYFMCFVVFISIITFFALIIHMLYPIAFIDENIEIIKSAIIPLVWVYIPTLLTYYFNERTDKEDLKRSLDMLERHRRNNSINSNWEKIEDWTVLPWFALEYWFIVSNWNKSPKEIIESAKKQEFLTIKKEWPESWVKSHFLWKIF